LLVAAPPQCLVPLSHLSQPDALFRRQHLKKSRLNKGTKTNRGRLGVSDFARPLVNQSFVRRRRLDRFGQRPLCQAQSLYGGLSLILQLGVDGTDPLNLIRGQV
jgi:hypothetical protein